MAVKIKTQYGDIEITNDVIATVVGGAATEIFGIVGMASKNQIRDNLNEILKRDNYAKGSLFVKKMNEWRLMFTLLLVMELRFRKFAVMYKIKSSII